MEGLSIAIRLYIDCTMTAWPHIICCALCVDANRGIGFQAVAHRSRMQIQPVHDVGGLVENRGASGETFVPSA